MRGPRGRMPFPPGIGGLPQTPVPPGMGGLPPQTPIPPGMGTGGWPPPQTPIPPGMGTGGLPPQTPIPPGMGGPDPMNKLEAMREALQLHPDPLTGAIECGACANASSDTMWGLTKKLKLHKLVPHWKKKKKRNGILKRILKRLFKK